MKHEYFVYLKYEGYMPKIVKYIQSFLFFIIFFIFIFFGKILRTQDNRCVIEWLHKKLSK